MCCMEFVPSEGEFRDNGISNQQIAVRIFADGYFYMKGCGVIVMLF